MIGAKSEDARQVRNSDYMLDNKNQLQRVVELWEDPAKPDENQLPERKAAARKSLQAVLAALGKWGTEGGRPTFLLGTCHLALGTFFSPCALHRTSPATNH